MRLSLKRDPAAPPRKPLRERAAELRAAAMRLVRPVPAAGDEDSLTAEAAATMPFEAYTFDDPTKDPTAWANTFAAHAVSMHIADRTLRMTKPELVAFIRDADRRDADLPEIMLRTLGSAQETFEGWGKLLTVASARYLVAAAVVSVQDSAASAAP